MFLQCVILSFVLFLCTATTVRKGGGIGRTTSFQCDGEAPYTWTISNGESPPYQSNIQQSGDILKITSIVYQHEGNYTCKNDRFELIVLAVVKFQGDCSPYQDCDLGVTSTLPEGQPIPLNISYDFVNGGPRGENQMVEFMRFKQDGASLLSCSSAGCSIPYNVPNVVKSSDSNINNIQANVTDDRPINASRVFVVELDIKSTGNLYETITATFTVSVTSTSTVLPTSSSIIPADTTSSSVVAVPMTSTVIIDPPLTSTAFIPSPSPSTSSSASESVLSPPPSSTNKPEGPSSSSSSISSSSSSSISSSSSSSISSTSSPVITAPPVPTAISDPSEDHVVLASILSAFIVTIIVIVLFLAVPFLILYNSKRSTSVSSGVNNSQETLDRPPEIVIERSTRTEITETAIYAEIKPVNDEMLSHNVIRNIHYVSNGSSSSSITDGQSYVDYSPYDIPPVVGELKSDLNSDWTPAV
ncbi:PREDICTED: uncharacterized protein YMR317W-like [Amphimedon queenslandica]|uniref:Ig-like domain-containing protein n=1 Tax=Amphimedon queenslandica TaxID=400682 RepID=A0A1X7VN57_AMPQE|nr:PREDICTED: uncharacterized protein YMR317W-like [Amphimedon queenslandica]|eukprot:XP_019862435.1 PREDICTED: uncharacterized protein YMR317W-like [Amphimedon queenslandica]